MSGHWRVVRSSNGRRYKDFASYILMFPPKAMNIKGSLILSAVFALAILGSLASSYRPAAASPLSKLSWMIGKWHCAVRDSVGVLHGYATEIVERSTTADALSRREFYENNEGSGQIGYSKSRNTWYEYMNTGDVRQELFGVLNLDGNRLELKGKAFKGNDYIIVRARYSWSGHDQYSFQAEAIGNDGSWKTLERHDCTRVPR